MALDPRYSIYHRSMVFNGFLLAFFHSLNQISNVETCTPLVEVTTDLNVHQHHHVQPQSSSQEEAVWTTDLLDCFEDATSCCYGFWCCPCLSCTVSGRMQAPYCLPLCDFFSCLAILASRVPVLVPPAGLALRLSMRNKYKIRGSVLNDMTVACCCSWCSWCQMHRELKHRMKSTQVVNVRSVVSVQPPPLMEKNQQPVTMDTSLLMYRNC